MRDWKQAAGPEPERVTEHVPEPASVSAAGDDSLLTPGRIAVVVIAYNRAPCALLPRTHARLWYPAPRHLSLGRAARCGPIAQSERPCSRLGLILRVGARLGSELWCECLRKCSQPTRQARRG